MLLNNLKIKNNQKIVLILLFSIITLNNLIILSIPPSSGYEVSIYDAFPIYFWTLFFFQFCLSIFLLFFFAIYEKNDNWKYAFIAILISLLIILLLPLIRNYVFGVTEADDTLAHIGYAKAIINQNFIIPTDWYPTIHILYAVFFLLGVPYEKSTYLFIGFFGILYVIFILLLTRTISKNNSQMLVILIFSTIPIFSYLYPEIFPLLYSCFYIPLCLYLFHKIKILQKKFEFIILFCIISLFIIFTHPLTSIFLLVIFLIILISSLLEKITIYKNENFYSEFFFVFFIAICFLVWYFSYHHFLETVGNFFDVLFQSSTQTTTVFEGQLQIMERVKPSISTIVDRFVKFYGPIALSFFLVILNSSVYFFQSRQKKKDPQFLMYSSILFSTIAIEILCFFSINVIREIFRIISFSLVFCMILAGYSTYLVFQNIQSITFKKIYIVSIVIIVFFSVFLSVQNIYDDPWGGKFNRQVSEKGKAGFDWYITKNDNQVPFYCLENSPRVYALYYFGADLSNRHSVLYFYNMIPLHFRDNNNQNLKDIMNIDTGYFMINEHIRQFPSAKLSRESTYEPPFNNDDVYNLTYDHSIDKIYSNKEIDTYFI